MYRCFFIGLAICSALTITSVQAQVEYNTVQNVRIYSPGFTPYKGVEGSPYIPSDTVQNGWLLNGAKRLPVKLRYNSYTSEIEYVEGDKIMTPANSVTEFAIITPDTLHFRKGFPATEVRSAPTFYQVLFNGRKAKLLKYVFATIKSNNEPMSNEFGKRAFLKREEYYVWTAKAQPPAENYFEKLSEGEMKLVSLNKKALVSLFPQQADRIDKYVADKKVKFKSWTDVASVLRYLETI